MTDCCKRRAMRQSLPGSSLMLSRSSWTVLSFLLPALAGAITDDDAEKKHMDSVYTGQVTATFFDPSHYVCGDFTFHSDGPSTLIFGPNRDSKVDSNKFFLSLNGSSSVGLNTFSVTMQTAAVMSGFDQQWWSVGVDKKIKDGYDISGSMSDVTDYRQPEAEVNLFKANFGTPTSTITTPTITSTPTTTTLPATRRGRIKRSDTASVPSPSEAASISTNDSEALLICNHYRAFQWFHQPPNTTVDATFTNTTARFTLSASAIDFSEPGPPTFVYQITFDGVWDDRSAALDFSGDQPAWPTPGTGKHPSSTTRLPSSTTGLLTQTGTGGGTGTIQHDKKPLPTGAISGIVVGGAILIALLVMLGWCLLAKRRRRKRQFNPVVDGPSRRSSLGSGGKAAKEVVIGPSKAWWAIPFIGLGNAASNLGRKRKSKEPAKVYPELAYIYHPSSQSRARGNSNASSRRDLMGSSDGSMPLTLPPIERLPPLNAVPTNLSYEEPEGPDGGRPVGVGVWTTTPGGFEVWRKKLYTGVSSAGAAVSGALASATSPLSAGAYGRLSSGSRTSSHVGHTDEVNNDGPYFFRPQEGQPTYDLSQVGLVSDRFQDPGQNRSQDHIQVRPDRDIDRDSLLQESSQGGRSVRWADETPPNMATAGGSPPLPTHSAFQTVATRVGPDDDSEHYVEVDRAASPPPPLRQLSGGSSIGPPPPAAVGHGSYGDGGILGEIVEEPSEWRQGDDRRMMRWDSTHRRAGHGVEGEGLLHGRR